MNALLQILMGPWTTYILWLLYSQGTMRFGELKRALPDISAKVLTERLRMLERAGMIHRNYKPLIPPQVSYSLSDRGHDLNGVLTSLNQLALKWQDTLSATVDEYGDVEGAVGAPDILLKETITSQDGNN